MIHRMPKSASVKSIILLLIAAALVVGCADKSPEAGSSMGLSDKEKKELFDKLHARKEAGKQGGGPVGDPNDKLPLSEFDFEQYPGAISKGKDQGYMKMSYNGGRARILDLISTDEPSKILEFYEKQIKVSSRSTVADGGSLFGLTKGNSPIQIDAKKLENGRTEILINVSDSAPNLGMEEKSSTTNEKKASEPSQPSNGSPSPGPGSENK